MGAWYDTVDGSGQPIPFWARFKAELADPHWAAMPAAKMADELNARLVVPPPADPSFIDEGRPNTPARAASDAAKAAAQAARQEADRTRVTDVVILGPDEQPGPADDPRNRGKVQRRPSNQAGEISDHPLWRDLIASCPGAPALATAAELAVLLKDPRANG